MAGESLLEAQQTAALQIPYKNMAVFDNMLNHATNAFYMGTEISRKRQALENQIEAMKTKAQQTEFLDQMKEKEFARKQDQFSQMMAWRDHESNMKDLVTNWKLGKDQEAIEDIGNMASGFSAIDLPLDSPQRPSAIWDVIKNNARGAKAAPGMIRDAFGTYNRAAGATRSKFGTDLNDFLKDVKNTVGRGQSTDLDPLYHPEIWKDEWVDKQGVRHAPPPVDEKGAVPDYAKDWKKTDQQYATFPNTDTTKPPIYVKLPAQKLKDLRDRLKALDERKRTLPEQVTNEYDIPHPGGRQLSDQDRKMLQYARDHPGDPNSAAILKKNGVDY
jgi:hypothetical protein